MKRVFLPVSHVRWLGQAEDSDAEGLLKEPQGIPGIATPPIDAVCHGQDRTSAWLPGKRFHHHRKRIPKIQALLASTFLFPVVRLRLLEHQSSLLRQALSVRRHRLLDTDEMTIQRVN